jgi:hypothetical protein
MVCIGQPILLCRERGQERRPRHGETWWRRGGDRDWKAESGFDGTGLCEFAWRDPATGFIRDRSAAIILPAEFSTQLKRRADDVELQVTGWPGQVQVEPGLPLQRGGWAFRTRGATASVATIRLSSGGRDIVLKESIPHQAWIFEWSGRPLSVRQTIGLSELHFYVARADGRCELMARLLDRDGHPVPQAEMRWTFDDELPLASIRDDVAGLILPSDELDVRVELNFNDGRDDHWYVSEFAAQLVPESRGLVLSRALLDENAQLVGRPLHDPTREESLGVYDLTQQLSSGPIPVSSREGFWLLYFRAQDRVLTRPYLIQGGQLKQQPNSRLGKAMAIPFKPNREEALLSLLVNLETDHSATHALMREFIDLVVSLRGLQPETFDILAMLTNHPQVAVRMLFEAQADELSCVIDLETGLPFAWTTIRKEVWIEVARARFEWLMSALPETLTNKVATAAQAISSVRCGIAALQPALASVLELPSSTRELREAAQDMMRRAQDRASSFMHNPFRPDLSSLLPSWQFREDCWRALDAPCAAALACSGRAQLTPAQTRCVKDVARNHPRYFEEAFSAFLRETNLG